VLWSGIRPAKGEEGGFTNLQLRQRFSRVERVTGIEPALSAWEPTWCGQSTAADRLVERGAATRLSPRLTVSRRQLGHAKGTGKLSTDEVTGDQLVATARDDHGGGAGAGELLEECGPCGL
jgi:hypothetical protein